MTLGDPKRVSVLSLCQCHHEIDRRREQLYDLLADIEAMLVDHHAWFQLTRVQRRALPAAQILYDTEDELEQLDRESAQLVIDLQSAPALSVCEAIAKLDVVARVIEPDDYPNAHAVLARAIDELRAFLRACSLSKSL